MVCVRQPSDREKWDGSWRASESVAESWGPLGAFGVGFLFLKE